jgi:hypothetical protein
MAASSNVQVNPNLTPLLFIPCLALGPCHLALSADYGAVPNFDAIELNVTLALVPMA